MQSIPSNSSRIHVLRAHGTFSSINYVICHKIILRKFKIKIIPTTFTECNDMKLEINNKRKNKNSQICVIQTENSQTTNRLKKNQR